MGLFKNAFEDLPEHEDDDKFDFEKEFPEYSGWEMIGFHRPLGDQMWEFALELLSMVTGILTIGFFTALLYPFPEIRGYESLSGSVFAVANRLFDIGVGYGISRFIAEYRVKDLEKMLMYVRFYVWYQIFSGALQITIISIIIFKLTIETEFAYLTWLILFGLSKQWPGMLSVFNTVIGGLQHYDKTNILGFLQGQVFQELTRIIFILIGRWYGETHPEMGLILGMAIGYAIGSYIDDILIMIFAGKILSNILKPMGFELRDVISLRIDNDVVRQSLFYRFQASMYPIVDSTTRQIIFFWYVDAIPGLATWEALSGAAAGIAGVVGTFGSFSLTSSIAESYSNGKKELAEWYVTTNIKWRYFFTTAFVVGVISALPYIEIFINMEDSLAYYQSAMIFFFPHLVVKFLDPFKQLPDYIFHGAMYITQFNILRIVEEVIEVFFVWLWLFPLNVQEMGTFGIIFLVGLKTRVSVFVKTVMAYIYIQRKIMKIRVAWYSSIIIPFIAASPIFIFSQVWLNTAFYPILNSLGLYVAIILTLVMLIFVCVLFVYMPLTGVLGWWSDYELFIFRKAVALSGPSKPIFKTCYRTIEVGIKYGKKFGTHGKHSIDHELPHKQIRELLELKRSADIKNK
jgi:hypothetical protein